jgi:hypothetical protein
MRYSHRRTKIMNSDASKYKGLAWGYPLVGLILHIIRTCGRFSMGIICIVHKTVKRTDRLLKQNDEIITCLLMCVCSKGDKPFERLCRTQCGFYLFE